MWPFKSKVPPPDWLRLAPGPSPWYLRVPGLSLPSDLGPLMWRDAGEQEPLTGKTVLSGSDGQPLLLLDFHCYVQPLQAHRFVVWAPEPSGRAATPLERSGMRFTVFDADQLRPLGDLGEAAAATQRDARAFHAAGGEVATLFVPSDNPPGRRHVQWPEPMHELVELLILAHSTHGGMTSNYFDRMNLCLWLIRPREASLEVIPQDWFNDGAYDFGYQWVTRLARDPESGQVVGEGIRLPAFVLDASLRQVQKWLPGNPFSGSRR